MEKLNVITISRTYGSGGKEIAKELAQTLGFAFYDEDIPRLACERSGLPEEFFDEDHAGRGSLLYSLAMGMQGGRNLPFYYNNLFSDDRVFALQSDIIREKAALGNAIFVGRCAGYVLRHEENCLNVFLTADMDIARVAELLNITADAARKKIQKTDKSRRTYYTYYTNHEWGETTDFHMCLNISKLGQTGAARLIEEYLKLANQ